MWFTVLLGLNRAGVGRAPPRTPHRASSVVCQFGEPVADLKRKYAVANFASRAAPLVGDDEQTMLRFLIGEADADAAEAAMAKAVEWRDGAGKSTVDAAAGAIAAATSGGGWDNAPVVAAAPHSDLISPYLGASQIQTLASQDGAWLIYCIRASSIDDGKLMAQVTKQQLSEYFGFVKEVHARVAAARTKATGRLVGVMTVNDLSGINLFGSSAFRDALSLASKSAAPLYPGLAGPTVLLNLPPLLNALVQVFKPLFPPAVAARIKFQQGPLSKVKDLAELLPNSPDNVVRRQFLDEVAQMVTK